VPPIIHRDLKPDNILLNDKYESKISDFGISKYLNTNLSATISQKGNQYFYKTKGTPSYQSPEQFPQSNKPIVGKPADVYCFGSILYEVLFGISPWTLEKVETLDDLNDLVVKQFKRPGIPTDKEITPEMKSLIEIMNKCWLNEQNERPTFDEIIDNLLEIEKSIGKDDINVDDINVDDN
jgi:serine/threonine protein kinase